MSLDPGTHDNFTGTMAAAMEAAFLNQWTKYNGDLPVPTGKKLDSMRLFFVAVAQGVVQHLRDNPDAINLTVDSGGSGGGAHTHDAEVSSISTTHTTA